MCSTCNYLFCMSTMIQIRNVPDALHRRLKSRAALAGMSLSDYLLRHPHDVLLPRVWELRNNLSAYDAVYLALAEALDASLLTHDQRLATATRRHSWVQIL